MTLPASGQLSMSDINTELGNTSTAQITLNDTSVRSLLKRTTNASEIGMNAAYGGNVLKNLVASGWQFPCYSADGINWTKGAWPPGLASTAGSPPGSNGPYTWYWVIYGNGKYIAATSSFPLTKLAYSTDGITWAEAGTSPINAVFTCGAYGNGVYVFLSNQGGANMITSTNGINWTSRTVGGNSWYNMTYANGIFTATGGTSPTIVAKSTDGINWSTVTYSRGRGHIEYGNGMWIQLGPGIPNGTSYYYTSTDNGATWTERIGPYQVTRNGFEAPGGFNGVLYGNGKWVLWSSVYSSAYSSDGINWTTFMLPVGNFGAGRGTFVKGLNLFVLVGAPGTTNIGGTVYTNNRCITSSDGVTWTPRTIPTTEMNGAGPGFVIPGYVNT